MRLAAKLALLLLSFSLFAQVRESVTVSVVEVPVTVTDRDGNPVRGLTTANFELLDDGKPRPITSVDVIDFKSKESIAAVPPINPAARRNFLILFDLSYSSPSSMIRAQQAARDFLSSMTDRRDKVAVSTIDVEKGFRLLTAFTTDRKAVNDALAAPMVYRSTDPLQISGHDTISKADLEQDVALGGKGRVPDLSSLPDVSRMSNRATDEANRGRIQHQIDILGGLAKTLRSVNGRKHVVFLSEGFDPRLVQGRDAGLTAQQIQENNALERGRTWEVDTDSRYGNVDAMNVLQKMGELCRRSDVVLDAFDIRGLRLVDSKGLTVDSVSREGTELKSNEGLYLLASTTGGQVFKNSADIREDFQRLLKQQEVTYVVAFQAPASSPGKYHSLKVRLVNVPAGRVSHRAGYYETGGMSATERSLSNAEVILNDIPQNAIHLATLIAAFPTGTSNAQVPVIVEASGADILKYADGNAASAEILVYAFDDEGTVRDALFQRLGLDLTKVGETLKSTGIKYYGTLSLPPGHYAIKTLVRVPNGDAKGFSRTELTVTRNNEVAMSRPIFFADAAPWVMVKGSSHDSTDSPYPFQVNGETFIPAAAVHAGKQFVVFVQNVAPGDFTVETSPRATVVKQVKSANGTKVIMQLDSAPTTSASLDVTMRMKDGAQQKTSVPLGQ